MNLLLVDPGLATVLDLVKAFIYAIFILSAVLLTFVILVQEGKGGGLGSAFGGAAADAFGVKAGTVNRFTAWLAAAFLGLALLYAGLSSSPDRVSLTPEEPSVGAPPSDPADVPGEQPADEPVDEPADEPADSPDAPDAPEETPDAPDAPQDPPPEGDGTDEGAGSD